MTILEFLSHHQGLVWEAVDTEWVRHELEDIRNIARDALYEVQRFDRSLGLPDKPSNPRAKATRPAVADHALAVSGPEAPRLDAEAPTGHSVQAKVQARMDEYAKAANNLDAATMRRIEAETSGMTYGERPDILDSPMAPGARTRVTCHEGGPHSYMHSHCIYCGADAPRRKP